MINLGWVTSVVSRIRDKSIPWSWIHGENKNPRWKLQYISVHQLDSYILLVTSDVRRSLMCVEEFMRINPEYFTTSSKTQIYLEWNGKINRLQKKNSAKNCGLKSVFSILWPICQSIRLNLKNELIMTFQYMSSKNP